MYKNINSASRIHALLNNALAQPDKPLFAVLAEVFEVKGKNDTQTAELVIPHLHWFQLELQLLESQIRQSNISSHLYEGAFARVRQVLSPLNLSAGWNGIRGNLTADVLLAFAFCNEFLPDEEAAISPDELSAINSDLADLLDTLETSELPDALRRLIEHHIQLIQKALAQYKIFGAKALREAGHAALGEIIETQNAIDTPIGHSEEISRLGKLWKRVNMAADTALKAEKIGQLGQRAWDVLSLLVQ